MAKGQSETTVLNEIQWSRKIECRLWTFFKVLTISPIRYEYGPTGLKIHFCRSIRLFSYLAIITVILYVVVTIVLRIIFFNVSSELKIWNEATNIFGLLTTCLVIIIETQLTYKHFSHFLQLKRKIEDELRILCRHNVFENEKYVFVRNYWRLIVGFHFFAFLTEILNLFYFQKDLLWRFYCCWFLLPVLFTRYRCFQHRLYTTMIHFYIKMIRMKIQNCIHDIEYNESLARHQHRRQFHMNSQKIFIDLNSSMEIFTSIFRMSCLVNEMFGFSLLSKIFENFIQMLSHFFWIYTKLYHQDLNNVTGLSKCSYFTLFKCLKLKFSCIGILLRVFPTLSIIIIMLASCENCTKEVNI